MGEAITTILFTGERYLYVTTTILDAWGWERAGCPLDHAVLCRVARPGGTHVCLGCRVLAQRPLSRAEPFGNAPAHAAVSRPLPAPSSPASPFPASTLVCRS